MPAKRIAIIGGGSVYMTSMLSSIARFATEGSLAGSHVVLMDIDEKNLSLIESWASAGAKAGGVPLTFSKTTNLDESLKDVDFVLSVIRPGGLDSRYLDETIPLKYGELGNETVGVGGVFMGLRTIPHAVKIAESIQKHSPKAWLINYTNPAHQITLASMRAGHARTIGLCDGVFGVKWLACKLIGIDTNKARDVDALVAGVNHCTWTTKLFYNGRDIYAELDDILKRIKIEPVGYEDINQSEFNWIDANAIRLYKYYGILPGSTYYARDYYTLTDYKQRLASAGHEHRSEFLRRIAVEKRELIHSQLKAGKCRIAPLDQEDAAHGDQAIGVMNAIATDSRMLETVNVRNNGAVPFLPEDAVVEVGAVLTSVGALPIAAGNLPVGVQAVVKGAHDFGKLVVDASFQKDRRLVLQAAMAHPAHRDIDTMEKIIAEMFEAHKKWINF